MRKSAAGKKPDPVVSDLSAVSLKNALWDTLKQVKAGTMTPASGDVVASQAREILRAVRTQLQIASQSGRSVTREVVDFSEVA